MTNLFVASSGLWALSVVLFSPQVALADCDPNAVICAEARIEIRGQASVKAKAQAGPQAPAKTIIVEEEDEDASAKAAVVVQAPPAAAPVAPAPPAPAVIESQPAPVAAPMRRQRVRRPRAVSKYKYHVGLHAQATGMFSDHANGAGIIGGIRLRPSRYFGVQVQSGMMIGEGYAGESRREIPLIFDFMFFLAPESVVQPYFFIGLGGAVADVDDPVLGNDTRSYLGGNIGLGLELRLGRHFALTAEGRAFLRGMVTDDDRPEYIHPETGKTTSTTAGFLGSLGVSYYF